jgi:hypothetical protein
MEVPRAVAISLLVYALIWLATLVGTALIRSRNRRALRARIWLINKRIEQFQHPPFKNLLTLWIAGKFFRTSAWFGLLVALPAAALFFLLGLLLVTPLLSLYQGLVVGLLIARYDRRHMCWAMAVAPFEFGYWALSGGLGISVPAGMLIDHVSFTESFLVAVDGLASGYGVVILLCMLINVLVEVAGPIFWRMGGPISLETLRRGEPVDEGV